VDCQGYWTFVLRGPPCPAVMKSAINRHLPRKRCQFAEIKSLVNDLVASVSDRPKTGHSGSQARIPKAATLVLHAAKLHERGHPIPKKVAVFEWHEPIWRVDG
jgi:hypothetical protein